MGQTDLDVSNEFVFHGECFCLFVFSESPNESSWALLLNTTVEQPELRVG